MKQSVILLVIIVSLFHLLSCDEEKKSSAIKVKEEFRDSTSIIVSRDTSTYQLTSTSAYLFTDKLSIIFDNEEYKNIDLELQNKGNNWEVIGVSGPMILDCLFVSSQFNFLSQNTSLNQA